MTRGIRLEPKLAVTYHISDLTLETMPIVQDLFGRTFSEVKDAIRLMDPKRASEVAIEVSQKELSMGDMKDLMVSRAMEKTDGNIRAAAKLLGVAERSMYRWLRDKGKEALA